MIKVQLSGEFQFNEKDLNTRNYALSIMTDCWITININGEVFLDDWICPLELYFQYFDWKQDLDNGLIKDFEYVSDDNGKNPILSFNKVGDKWTTYSVLTQKTSEFITESDILQFFESFEMQLLKHKTK